jgi:hypothetical protein
MLCSFVSLSLASFLFSVVSGEELCGRAFAEGVAAGAMFGIGATGMFLSICWLFAAQRIGGHTVIWVKALMVVERRAVGMFDMATGFSISCIVLALVYFT